MTKFVHADVYDNGLSFVAANAERCVVVSNDPAAYADVATGELAAVSLTSGDFTLANGDVSGRKITMAAKTTTVATEGDPTHLVWVDDTNSKLLYKTEESTTQTIFVGNDLNIPALKLELNQPA
mgnify:CR=1 FL=1